MVHAWYAYQSHSDRRLPCLPMLLLSAELKGNIVPWCVPWWHKANYGMIVCWHAGMLTLWKCNRMLAYMLEESLNGGMLDHWNAYMLTYWKSGMLECMPECWNAGMLECWNAGMLECWNAGTLQCWDAGKLESWKADMMLKFCHTGMHMLTWLLLVRAPECWHHAEHLKYCHTGMLHMLACCMHGRIPVHWLCWNAELLEFSHGDLLDCCNADIMLTWQNAGMVKCIYDNMLIAYDDMVNSSENF